MNTHGINVYSSSADVVSLLSRGSFTQLIPEYKCSLQPSAAGYSLVVMLSDELPFTLGVSPDRKTFTVTGSKDGLLAGHTLPHLIHSVLEIQRLEDGQFTMRAAAVAKNGQGFLLLGRPGAGKTSVSLWLCRKYGYSLIGNNIVLTGIEGDQAYLYGGEKVFRFRRASILHYNTDLAYVFDGHATNLDDWMTTATLLPEQVDVTTTQGKIPIVAAFYLHLLNDATASLYLEPMNPLTSRLFLYETTSEYVRGVCSPILIGSNLLYGGFLPSLDTPAFHERRVRFINWVIAHPTYQYISGSMEAICAHIDSALRGY